MRSITGRRPLLASLLGVPRDELLRGVAGGLAVLIPLVVADIFVGSNAVLPSAYVLGPFAAAALAAAVTPTLLVALLALALGAVSPAWNHNFGHVGYWLRLAELSAGGGLALLTAWLRGRSRAYTRRLALLDEIGAIADGSLSLADTLQRAVELIVPDAADFAIIDAIHRGEVNRAAVRAGGRPDCTRIEERLRSRQPTAPFWLRQPEFGIPAVPQFLPQVSSGHVEILSQGPEDAQFLASLHLWSWITVPLIARRRLVGTLTVATAWSKRRYRREDLRFIRTLSGRLALALDNAGLFTDLESVERRMDAVLDRIPEAVMVHEASGTLVYANEPAARLVGAASAEELLRLRAASRLPQFKLYTEDGAQLPDQDPVVAAMRAERLPLRGVFRLRAAASREERWISVAVEPIRGPGGDLLYAVTTIADITAAKRAELAERLLAHVGELLRSARDYRRTLRSAADVAVPEFADWCAVCLPGDDGTVQPAAIAYSEAEHAEVASALSESFPQTLDGDSVIARVLRGEGPQLVEVTDELLRSAGRDPEHLDRLRELGLGTAIVVPMIAGAATVGAVAFVNSRDSARFDRHDLEVAVEFGQRAGLAAENARLAELRMEIATELQRGLLPPDLPAMHGWRLATMYRAAGELNEVGGDFYDAFEVDGDWMIVLGDAVGRGAAAASLTALARHTIHAVGEVTGDPLRALAVLNARLRQRDPAPLCSVAVILLRQANGGPARVEAVAAGHPLPLLCRGGVVTETAKPGPLLGALPRPRWESVRIDLQPGDQLVLYTDGVTDARAGGELFGANRLRRVLAGVTEPTAAVARVEQALTSFCGGDFADDAALIAIMREGEEGIAAAEPESAAATA